MIAWMLRTVLATSALAVAAALADALTRRAGLPRRSVWATALGLATLLPPAAAWLPATSPGPALALPPETLAALLVGSAATGAAGGRAFPELWLAGAAWVVVSAGLLATLAYAGWRLRRLCARWPTVRVEGGDVVVSTGAGPLVSGVLRPRVVVPPWVLTAPAAERRMVLAHEREHVRAGDARLLAAAAVLAALAPWNLPVWWLVRRLREAVETDCDRRVLAGGIAPADYGRLLLSTAAGPRPGLVPRVALAEPKRLLERRLIAMSEGKRDRRLRRMLPLGVGAAALLIVACEVARSDATAPATPVAPRASAADSARAAGREYERAYVAGRAAARAVNAMDSGVAYPRAHARDGALTQVTVRQLSPGEADITTVDAEGKTEVHHIRVHGRLPAAPPEQALADVMAVEQARGAAAVEAVPAHASAAAHPLVFVDGVKRTEADLRRLNPDRIRSIDVLKGEAARREYGERGANGVIRVTTK